MTLRVLYAVTEDALSCKQQRFVYSQNKKSGKAVTGLGSGR